MASEDSEVATASNGTLLEKHLFLLTYLYPARIYIYKIYMQPFFTTNPVSCHITEKARRERKIPVPESEPLPEHKWHPEGLMAVLQPLPSHQGEKTALGNSSGATGLDKSSCVRTTRFNQKNENHITYVRSFTLPTQHPATSQRATP